MSKQKPSKKKVVVSTQKDNKKTASRKPAQARTSKATGQTRELTFGRETYMWMGLGFLLVVIGLALMTGGKMPSTDVWDDDLIYSTRRVVIAPMVILAGLIVEIYAIFKK